MKNDPCRICQDRGGMVFFPYKTKANLTVPPNLTFDLTDYMNDLGGATFS